MPPLRPHKEESDHKRNERMMALWTGRVGLFTLALVLVAFLQFYSFVESERACLVLEDVHFTYGEPSIDGKGTNLILVIKNIGKHVTSVHTFKVKPSLFIVQKELPDLPCYGGSTIKVIPPFAPDEGKIVDIYAPFLQNTSISNEERIKGIKSGNFPFRVFGFIEYDMGYLFLKGNLGFCSIYIPEKIRRNPIITFETCDNPKYTYIH